MVEKYLNFIVFVPTRAKYLLNNYTAPIRKPFNLFAEGFHRLKWGPKRDARQTIQTQVVQLFITIDKRTVGNRTLLKLGAALSITKKRDKNRNFVTMTLQIKAYLGESPHKSRYARAAKKFRTTKSSISQLLDIIDKLPNDFITKMEHCERRGVFKIFSVNILKRISEIDRKDNQWNEINRLLVKNDAAAL